MEPARGEGQDAAGAFVTTGGCLLALSDGAGGMSGGARASQMVVETCARAAASGDPGDLTSLLLQLDHDLYRSPAAGLAKAVLLHVSASGISGASVGDSQAWLVSDGRVAVLTEHQKRKPLLGSGTAVPVFFSSVPVPGATLLLGSDGLFNYVSQDRLVATLPKTDAANHLIAAARLPTGTLQDDLSLIICRPPQGGSSFSPTP